jgi:DNA-binding GntR family transcriptional regulator
MDSHRDILRVGTAGVGTQTLSDRVFGVVETAIVTGDIPLGAKLGESALAKRCGVSRGPLREALRRLEGRHLVERTPHAGVRVVSLPRDDAVQIYLVREALEGMACRLAALAMAERDIDELERLLDRHSLSEALRAGQAYHQNSGDLDFHFQIVLGSANPRLIQLLCRDLYSLIRLCRFKTNRLPGRSLRAYEEHGQIVKAIRRRDPDLAEMLMRRHIADARSLLQESEESAFTPPPDPSEEAAPEA